MIIGSYEIDIEEMISIIQEKKFQRILLQLPDGLKYHSNIVLKELINQVSCEWFISADSCYGACDFPCPEYIGQIGVDAIFQLGHTTIPSMNIDQYKIPVFFINAQATCSVDAVIQKTLSELVGKSIIVVTTAQHLHQLERVQDLLTENGFIPHINSGDGRIDKPGQILGCNTSVVNNYEKSDCILFIGSGVFHPIALLLSTRHPVISADPFTGEVQKDSLQEMKEDILKKRYMAIAKAKDANCFGIIISSKPGQKQPKKAEECKQILEEQGKEVYTFIMDHISSYQLEQFPSIDCFVSTACPRIAIDDGVYYKKPIITPVELKIIFEKISYEDYRFDEITDDS